MNPNSISGKDVKKEVHNCELLFPLKAESAAVFFDSSVLRRQTLEVCQLRTSYLTIACDFDMIDNRAVDRECTLYTDTAGDLTYGECLTDAAVLLGYAYAFEHLNTGLFAFTDSYINLYRVTRLEVRDVVAHLFFCDLVNQIEFHAFYSPFHTSDHLLLALISASGTHDARIAQEEY